MKEVNNMAGSAHDFKDENTNELTDDKIEKLYRAIAYIAQNVSAKKSVCDSVLKHLKTLIIHPKNLNKANKAVLKSQLSFIQQELMGCIEGYKKFYSNHTENQKFNGSHEFAATIGLVLNEIDKPSRIDTGFSDDDFNTMYTDAAPLAKDTTPSEIKTGTNEPSFVILNPVEQKGSNKVEYGDRINTIQSFKSFLDNISVQIKDGDKYDLKIITKVFKEYHDQLFIFSTDAKTVREYMIEFLETNFLDPTNSNFSEKNAQTAAVSIELIKKIISNDPTTNLIDIYKAYTNCQDDLDAKSSPEIIALKKQVIDCLNDRIKLIPKEEIAHIASASFFLAISQSPPPDFKEVYEKYNLCLKLHDPRDNKANTEDNTNESLFLNIIKKEMFRYLQQQIDKISDTDKPLAAFVMSQISSTPRFFSQKRVPSDDEQNRVSRPRGGGRE